MQEKETLTNHETELKTLAEKFMNAWFKQSIREDTAVLSDYFMLPQRKTIDKKSVVNKINTFFKGYAKFVGGRYDIIDVGFELMEEGKGFACVEGAAGYRGVFPNAGSEILSGPFKLYFTLQYGQWKIVHLVFPGFSY